MDESGGDGVGNGLDHAVELGAVEQGISECGVADAVGRFTGLGVASDLDCLDQAAVNGFCHKAVFYLYGAHIGESKRNGWTD